jgi:hypothetical protein
MLPARPGRVDTKSSGSRLHALLRGPGQESGEIATCFEPPPCVPRSLHFPHDKIGYKHKSHVKWRHVFPEKFLLLDPLYLLVVPLRINRREIRFPPGGRDETRRIQAILHPDFLP